MSSRPKPWYSERDCPVCTRGASSFRRDPLYSFAHATRAKWWYHAKFQHFQSSFCSDFQFHRHLAPQTNREMIEKQQMMSESAGNWWRRFECCILNAKIVWSSNKFKKHWSARVTDEFSYETLILQKSLSSLYTKCIQFLPWPSLLFLTCYAGEMMIPFQVSTFSQFIL